MTPEQTLDWLADQHQIQSGEDRPVQHWIRGMKSMLPSQPPQHTWIDLTDDEINEVVWNCKGTDTHKYFRAVEAKLKEKNT